jgi:diguanylate cyclase (GGDEF)-like protein/PAS domain S-box-containing protein
LVVDDPVMAETVRRALEAPGAGARDARDRNAYRVTWVRRCADALTQIASDEQREDARESLANTAAIPTAAIPSAGTDSVPPITGAGATPQPDEVSSRLVAILIDLRLPDGHGIEVFNQLFRAALHLPFLILSAEADEELAQSAVQLGAQDYLLKSRIDDYLLPKAVRSMTERAAIAEALFQEKERAQVTLSSIGDAVITTDLGGRVTYLNAVAERMTGWSLANAMSKPVDQVFQIRDSSNGQALPNPMTTAIRENATVRLTPNCVLVERDGGEIAIEDSAAPIHNHRGKPTGAVMVFHDVSMARALSLRMSHLAQHDSLTDLPNRVLLSDRLSQAVAMAQRNATRLALLFLDIDHFKGINDALGHAVGDRLLQSVAQRLLACVRSPDTVSRQGGDEFVVLLSEVAHTRDAALIAEKMSRALLLPHRIEPHELHVTVSIGIATYPEDGTDAEALMRHADSAMYHAKDSGRNNYQFYRTEMGFSVIEHRTIEAGLRHAVERKELVLHYQPQVDMDTGRIVSVEALLRWRREDKAAIPTALFVRVAEKCGLIVSIGHWVLQEACIQAKAWLDAGLPLPLVSVNVSEAEFRSKDFVSGVRETLTATGLPAHFLELELTETFLVRDLASTASVFRALKEIGVRLALDDFGTGYSSLSHLRGLPIDTLKIDQSFIQDMTSDPGDASIVSAMIGLGESLGMGVVAEGVETPEQHAFLLGHGCKVGQGYLFGRAMPAMSITSLLAGQAEHGPVNPARLALNHKRGAAPEPNDPHIDL